MWRRFPALLLVCSLLATGCWNRRELEEYAFVLALGIDKGARETYAVTASIAIPSRVAGKEAEAAKGGQEQPLVVTTVEAPTVTAALQMMDAWIDRRVSLLHAKTVFVGEEQAREDAFSPISQLVRFREARRTMFYVVTKGSANEFLEKMDIRLERDPQRFITQITNASLYTGFIPELAKLQLALTQLEANQGSLVYYAAIREDEEEWAARARPGAPAHEGAYVSGELPRKGGPNIDMMGSAVLADGKMQGLLTGQETRWVLIMRNRFRRGYFSVTDPRDSDKAVTLDIRVGRAPHYQVRVVADSVVIEGLLPLEGEIISIEGSTDYTDLDLQKVLEEAAARQLQEQVGALVSKAQQELRADVLGLGDQVVRRFGTVDEWERFDWQRRFPEAEVKLTVDLSLRRYGTKLSQPTP